MNQAHFWAEAIISLLHAELWGFREPPKIRVLCSGISCQTLELGKISPGHVDYCKCCPLRWTNDHCQFISRRVQLNLQHGGHHIVHCASPSVAAETCKNYFTVQLSNIIITKDPVTPNTCCYITSWNICYYFDSLRRWLKCLHHSKYMSFYCNTVLLLYYHFCYFIILLRYCMLYKHIFYCN